VSEPRPEGWIEPTMEAPEPEPDDDEEGDEQEPTVPSEGQPEPLTEARAEAILKALEREASRHAREVEKRAGPMFSDLTPCPCCTGMPGTPGFIVAELPYEQAEVRRMIVAQALGATAGPEYPADPDREMCTTCDGLGLLRTGSKVAAQEALPCRACNGQGWKQKLTPVQVPPMAMTVPQPSGNVTDDRWGRPLGHPHYNQDPALVGIAN